MTKAHASEFFFAVKGLMTHTQRSKATDRELDLSQFIEVCR